VRARRSAAAIVAALAVLLAGCGIPTDGSPQAIPRADVPFKLLDPSPPKTTTTVPPAVAVPETVYLVAPDQHLVPVTRDVALPASPTAILGALLDGPTEAESAAGLQSFLSASPSQVTVSVSSGVATVDFRTNPFQLVLDQTLAVAQVVYTATAQTGVTSVVIEIRGQSVDVPTAAGVQVGRPVTRLDYLAEGPNQSTTPTTSTSPTTTVPPG
jgi:spore germination protein GerM